MSAGSFLSAAIDSGMVPVVDLREVFRQAQGSDIVKAAHAVHAGLMPPLTRIDPSQPSEVCRLIPFMLGQHECKCLTNCICDPRETFDSVH